MNGRTSKLLRRAAKAMHAEAVARVPKGKTALPLSRTQTRLKRAWNNTIRPQRHFARVGLEYSLEAKDGNR